MNRSALAGRFRQAVNHEPRREGLAADMIVLHYTGMASARAAEDWLVCADSGVSCHYLVGLRGGVVQMVEESERAWHAGVAAWRGVTDINSCSIGIEIHNPGHDGGYPDFPDGQIEAVIGLCRDIAGRHGIAPERVLAHSDVAPGRKIDPGEKFPWARLHAAGVGHWITPAAITAGAALGVGDHGEAVNEMQAMLAAYGYGVPVDGEFGQRTRVVVEAFQRHFRPARVDGVADVSTRQTLRALLAALPGTV